MLSLQQIEYLFIYRYQFNGDEPTMNGMLRNQETPYLSRFFGLSLFIFVIDLSLFFYDE